MFRGLGNKLRQLFSQTLAHFMEETKEWIQERIGNAFIFILESIEKHGRKDTKEILDKIIDTPEIPDEIKKIAERAKSGEHEFGALLLSSLGGATLSSGATTVISPGLEKTRQALNRKFRPAIFSPADAVQSWYRKLVSEEFLDGELASSGYGDGHIAVIKNLLRPLISEDAARSLLVFGYITKEEYFQLLGYLGYTEKQAELLLKLGYRPLSVDFARECYLRGIITPEEHDQYLQSLGVRGEDIDRLKKLYFYIPSPGDLVRMAVREAWADKTAAMFGYDEEFPEEFAEWAEKQGMSREWAIRYWRAHWEIPSPTMGYEMLHRGIITEEELDTLLKTADYPTFWREKLIKLSYSPYTRVDIRRMYQLGILSAEDVFKAYKDIGYDDERAENLTKFTVAGASQSEKDITKSEILRGYKYKILTAEEAKENLIKMGYDESEAEYYIALQDYQEEKERKEDLIKRTKTEFTKGIINRNEVFKRLGAANLNSKEIEYYLSIWDNTRETKPKQPSLSDLKTMFKARIIDESTFREELSNMGYSDRYIDWYVKIIYTAATAE